MVNYHMLYLMVSLYNQGYLDQWKSLTIDNGTGVIKAGYNGHDAPKAVFPNIIGIPSVSIPHTQMSYILQMTRIHELH